jgi:hypothetical protein
MREARQPDLPIAEVVSEAAVEPATPTPTPSTPSTPKPVAVAGMDDLLQAVKTGGARKPSVLAPPKPASPRPGTAPRSSLPTGRRSSPDAKRTTMIAVGVAVGLIVIFGVVAFFVGGSHEKAEPAKEQASAPAESATPAPATKRPAPRTGELFPDTPFQEPGQTASQSKAK